MTTPAKAAAALAQGALTLRMLEQRLRVLVLDEADLLLSYGYEEDVQALAPQVSVCMGRRERCVCVAGTGGGGMPAQHSTWHVITVYL